MQWHGHIQDGMLSIWHDGLKLRRIDLGENGVYLLLAIRYHFLARYLLFGPGNDIGDAEDGKHIVHLRHVAGNPIHGLEDTGTCNIIRLYDHGDGVHSEALHIEVIVFLVELACLIHEGRGSHIHLNLLRVVDRGYCEQCCEEQDYLRVIGNPGSCLLQCLHFIASK
ncbi:Uncharacterised protein [uncultured archaeon]|nr:Uncharacterised protein [uncultured archaeon]